MTDFSDFNAMEILSHDDFWAKDPAPGTLFFELGESLMELVGSKIDIKLDDPSNAVAITSATLRNSSELGDGIYAVLKWGDWDTPENREIRKLQAEARELMAKENG